MCFPKVAGEFLMLKHLASNGKADPDAHLKRSKAARTLAATRIELSRANGERQDS